jgi:carbon monoxide dehydrogenase subunit G
MQVKLGPISLSFATDVKREEADEAARRSKLSARARETRGRGAAQATIESSLAATDGGGTKVDLVTDLSLTGAVAQYGRGIVQDVSSQLVTSFAECLKAQLTAAPERAQAAAAAQAKPVSGLSLGFGALGRSLSRFFSSLFRRG